MIIFLEIFANFFKLSGLMGIESGLIYNKSGIHYLKPNSTGAVFEKKVYTDKNGYRVPNKNFSYQGEKNILIIGDSQTFGNGVLEEETFIGLLRNKFENLNFYNSAVPGYQIKQHKENLKKFIYFKEVHKVIYFFTLNDVYDLSNLIKQKEDIIQKDKKEPKELKIKNFINSFLRNKSYLYMYLKGITSDPSKRWYQNIDSFYASKDISLTSNYFKELKIFSEKYNAELYVVILPYEYQTRSCKSDDFKPQAKISKILFNNKIKFFDFSKDFCNHTNPKKYFYKFDPAHFSVLGHKLIYKLINEKINL
jgi:hypothetical protein|tara:strand:+ start:130 stop:1053 length:924 start_codon:yes stop_codon:yes gene_type:complete